MDHLGLTVCGEGGRVSGQTGRVPTVVTRVFSIEVVRGVGTREWVQPIVALRAIAGSGGEHGHRRRSKLGNIGGGHTCLGEWVGNVGDPALNRTLTSRDGLRVVAEHGEHSQTVVLDLLHLQLSDSVRVVSLMVCGEGGRVIGQTGGVPTVVTRVLSSKVVRGGGIREWVPPIIALRAIAGSGGEHGRRGRSELGDIGVGHTCHGEWVGVLSGVHPCPVHSVILVRRGEHGVQLGSLVVIGAEHGHRGWSELGDAGGGQHRLGLGLGWLWAETGSGAG